MRAVTKVYIGSIRIDIVQIYVNSAVLVGTDKKPSTGHDVRGVNDVEDKSSKTGQIVLSLLRVLLEDAMKCDVQWLGKSWNMDKS